MQQTIAAASPLETAKPKKYKIKHSVLGVLGAVLKYFVLIGFALVVILPICWIVLSAFKTTSEIESNPFGFPKSLQFVNFANAWTKASMGLNFLNSIILTAGSLVLLVVLAVPAAYVLSRFRYKILRVMSVIFMAGLFVNMNYIVTPLFLSIFSISRALGLYTGLVDNRFTVMLIYAVTSLSFSIYLLSGYFRTMPKDFEEAAKIDGCGYFGTLIKICVPLALPSVATVIMFNFLSYWNEYLVVMTFLGSAKRSLPAGLLSIMRESKVANDLGRMYAGLLIVMVPVLAVYAVVQGQLTKGVTLGGIKG